MCLRAGKRLKKRLLGFLGYRRARGMYDVIIGLEIEDKDEHLGFRLRVPLIPHCQAVGLRVLATPFRSYRIINALNSRKIHRDLHSHSTWVRPRALLMWL